METERGNMPLKPGQSPKKSKSKKYGAIIPSKKDARRPLRPEKTEYTPKGTPHVTAIATSGRRKRPKYK